VFFVLVVCECGTVGYWLARADHAPHLPLLVVLLLYIYMYMYMYVYMHFTSTTHRILSLPLRTLALFLIRCSICFVSLPHELPLDTHTHTRKVHSKETVCNSDADNHHHLRLSPQNKLPSMNIHGILVSAQEHLTHGLAFSHRDSHSSHSEPTASLPLTLPCRDFYACFPHRVGLTGNVVMTSEDELQTWLLVARPVSRAEAEQQGGCIIFTPLSRCGKGAKPAEAQYYCITDPDDAVYGRAEYLPLAAACGVAIEDTAETFTNVHDNKKCDFDDTEEDKKGHTRCTRQQGCAKLYIERCECTQGIATTVCGRV
jgi:hypothetical protein